MKDILTLGIESSCDETSVSIVKNGREVLSNVINSQIKIHEKFGGVVPEIASRNHVEAISEVTKAALKEAGITAMLTDVVALRVPHATGSLNKAMHQIVDGEVNIEYMYAFANGADAAAVLKSDDPGRVIDILKGSGFDVYSADEAYRANQ